MPSPAQLGFIDRDVVILPPPSRMVQVCVWLEGDREIVELCPVVGIRVASSRTFSRDVTAQRQALPESTIEEIVELPAEPNSGWKFVHSATIAEPFSCCLDDLHAGYAMFDTGGPVPRLTDSESEVRRSFYVAGKPEDDLLCLEKEIAALIAEVRLAVSST